MSIPSSLTRKIAFLILAIGAGVIAVAGLSGCGSASEAGADVQVSTAPITVTSKGPVNQEGVQAILDRKLGDAGIAGQPVTRGITLTQEAGGVFVDISLNRTASCHPGQLVGTAIDITRQVMSAVFRYSDVSRIQVSLYGTTEQVADKDKLAARIMVTKDAAGKIDWYNYSDQNAEQLSTEFWIEPSIYANWKQYGSAAIADPNQRAAANGGVTTPAPAATP